MSRSCRSFRVGPNLLRKTLNLNKLRKGHIRDRAVFIPRQKQLPPGRGKVVADRWNRKKLVSGLRGAGPRTCDTGLTFDTTVRAPLAV